MTTAEISKETLEKATALGKEMAERDTWIEPVSDVQVADPNNYGEFQMAHREAWEQTCQFEILWGSRLTTLTEDAAAEHEIDKTYQWEAWYYGFYTPALDAMWDAWEEAKNLDQFWRDKIAE